MIRNRLLQTLLTAAFVFCVQSNVPAFEYIDAEFWQNAGAHARDYVGDPPSSSMIRDEITPAESFSDWTADRNIVNVSASRTHPCGRTGTFASLSDAAFHIDPFTLVSGVGSISQSIQASGYYHDERATGGDFCACEVFGGVGEGDGDSIRIRFRVHESDGNVLIRARSAFANPAEIALLNGGIGGVYVMQEGHPFLYPVSEAGNQLEPGEWTLVLQKHGIALNNGYWSRSARAHFSASWTFDDVYTGEIPSRPIVVITWRPDEDEPPPATDPDNIAGAKLTFPVTEGLGTSQDVFVGFQPRVPRGISAGALATGYEIVSEHSPFTSFTMPELPLGAGAMTIEFDGVTQPIVAGQVVDFGPEGLDSFTLAGFDPTAGVTPEDLLVMGLRFAEEGLASLVATPIPYIPPSDFDANGFVNGRDFLAWQRGESPNPLSAEDLALWQANYGAPLLSASASSTVSVPEPGALAIGLLVLVGAAGRRRF